MIHWNPYLALNGQCEAVPRSAGLQRNAREFRCTWVGYHSVGKSRP
jgi:hypothetical protein